MQMLSGQSETKLALFLTREAEASVRDLGQSTTWAEVANRVGALSGDTTVPTSTTIQATAVLCAYRDLLQAWNRVDPGRLERLTHGCRGWSGFTAASEQLRATWAADAVTVDTALAILVDVVSANRALSPVASGTGGQRWTDSVALQAWGKQLHDCDAAEPVPPGMTAGLIEMLMQPARACPDSLAAQLDWIAEAWSAWLSDDFGGWVSLSEDVAAEECTVRLAGPGPVQPSGFDSAIGFADASAYGTPGSAGYVDASARFSDDTEWMPGMVMMAKQTFVWLDQLSRSYGRDIHRLDQIPDEELDALADRGFRGLWLIGLWERSPASREIKVRRGNPEAAPSAYSLKDYAIAQSLGGEEALQTLKQRANARGLRLAADMVPNHMGMDSTWMAEHPERFLQLPQPPYPGYTFDGPDLSGDDRIEIYLEDGYWEERDAAVVFKCVDRASGQVRFVYHGNDGTQMPWNDTAQLDYLQPAVREAVIQTILDVARQFPIIRFDAAMTLARKHIARLWYPPPGGGGAIPSRAEHTVPPEVLDQLLPGEFWREVVERVRQEVPDTLLLAEAFWMMEGYFVRTLGMHRVYNSAFMHMLRDEDNAGYRGAIKQVLEYSPAILERYVNFMNNPDEETAVEQFGKGDKYFGIATMMSTLPGLPMYGHGQIEGFSEKYGMEYTRAYVDESPDVGLMDHHERVIFPILRERHKFCGVDHFALMDFWCDGGVDENVFAYANRSGQTGEPSLVIYNNAHTSTAGWVKTSSAINVGETESPELVHKSLGEALGVVDDPGVIYGFWELRRRAWLLRTGAEICRDGVFAELDGYGAFVFLDIRRFDDPDGRVREFVEGAGRGWVEDPFSIGTSAETTATPPEALTEVEEVEREEQPCEDDAPAESAVDAGGEE